MDDCIAGRAGGREGGAELSREHDAHRPDQLRARDVNARCNLGDDKPALPARGREHNTHWLGPPFLTTKDVNARCDVDDKGGPLCKRPGAQCTPAGPAFLMSMRGAMSTIGAAPCARVQEHNAHWQAPRFISRDNNAYRTTSFSQRIGEGSSGLIVLRSFCDRTRGFCCTCHPRTATPATVAEARRPER